MARWLSFLRFPTVAAAALLGAVAGCSHPPPEPELPGAVPVDVASADAFAHALLRATNRVRVEHGVPPLRPWPRLNLAADEHAAFMALRLQIGHTSDLPGQRTPGERVRRMGLEVVAAAENVAYFSVEEGDTAESIAARFVDGWLHSPGHRANLLNPSVSRFGSAVRLAKGVGRSRYAFGVQLFAEPKGGR